MIALFEKVVVTGSIVCIEHRFEEAKYRGLSFREGLSVKIKSRIAHFLIYFSLVT